jgi:hypothetical protein
LPTKKERRKHRQKYKKERERRKEKHKERRGACVAKATILFMLNLRSFSFFLSPHTLMFQIHKGPIGIQIPKDC